MHTVPYLNWLKTENFTDALKAETEKKLLIPAIPEAYAAAPRRLALKNC